MPLDRGPLATVRTRRFRIAMTMRSANGEAISQADCVHMPGISENPTTKCTRSGNQPVSRSTCCRAPREGDVSLHRTRRCLRQLNLIAFPEDVLAQSPDIGRALRPNNIWPLLGGRFSCTAVRPEKVPDTLAEVCRSLICRLWLVPNGPAVLGPDRLPGLDGLVRDPFLSCLDGVDGERFDHCEHKRCDATCNTKNDTWRLNTQTRSALQLHGSDQSLDQPGKLNIVIPEWQKMFVHPSRKLPLTANRLSSLINTKDDK